MNIGHAFLALGRTSDAIASSKRALELKSDDVEALDNLGLAFLRSGQRSDAAETLATVLRLDPDFKGELYKELGLEAGHQI